MADRSSQLVLSALTRAAADAAGVPLYGGKNRHGLFPTTALGKQAAQRCCDEGYLHPVQPGGNGRSSPVCTITEKGMTYLLGQVSPRQVLEDCARILEEREGQLAELLAAARQMQAGLESLRGTITGVLGRLDPPAGGLKSLFAQFRQESEAGEPAKAPADAPAAVLGCLERWGKSGAQEDCPLPELFRQLGPACPGLSIGAFHDALRGLHAAGRLYLHPWTGPLYQVPEPPYALLVGHEVAYYASLAAAVVSGQCSVVSKEQDAQGSSSSLTTFH